VLSYKYMHVSGATLELRIQLQPCLIPRSMRFNLKIPAGLIVCPIALPALKTTTLCGFGKQTILL